MVALLVIQWLIAMTLILARSIQQPFTARLEKVNVKKLIDQYGISSYLSKHGSLASNSKHFTDDSVRLVAGLVPIDPKTKMILLITSRSHPGNWILPKGGVKKSEKASKAAERETWEEAGVTGKVNSNVLGNWFDGKAKSHNRSLILFYEMEVDEILEDWPEKLERQRKWFTVLEAINLVKHPYMKEAIANSSASK